MNIRWLRFTKKEPYKMMFKYSVSDDEAFKGVNLKKRGKGRPKLIRSLSVFYPNGRPISKAKYTYIQLLLKYVPTVHHGFYLNLPHDSRSVLGPKACDDIVDIDSGAESDD